MSVLERCPGCGRTRLLFPGGRCLDCRDAGGLQLALPVDPRADDLAPAEREAVEAAVLHQERDRAREAAWSRPCRCSAPVVDLETCVLCGHEPEAVAA